MKITVQDFTGIYDYQPFMQELRAAAETSKDIHWLDCTKIVGTDCYCDDEAINKINEIIDNAESNNASENRSKSKCGNVSAIHFFDNGNYHYMSKLWTDKIQEPFTLIVFDHHPDMQPPRFGGILSCGGWVLEVLEKNKFIQNAIIIGVADRLVEEIQQEFAAPSDTSSNQNNLLQKVTFIRESEVTSLSSLDKSQMLASEMPMQALSLHSPYTFVADRLSSFVFRLSSPHSLYVSIDKDALAPTYAATNWDQGSLSVESLKKIITELAANHKILGIDICGERSQDFEGNEYHTIQDADSINNALNCELLHFLQNL